MACKSVLHVHFLSVVSGSSSAVAVVLGRRKYVMSTGIVYVSRCTVYRYGRSYDYTTEILSLVNST